MDIIPLPTLPEDCLFYVPVVWSSKSLRKVPLRGTNVIYWIRTVNHNISKVPFLRYLYLLAFCWSDADTDSQNFSGRIQIQIVQNATACPDDRYLARYPSIRTLPTLDTSNPILIY